MQLLYKSIFIAELSFLLLLSFNSSAQNNIIVTNAVAEQVMIGNYDPSQYFPPLILNHPDSIIEGIISSINADSLKSDLEKLASFHNRNTGSDTISQVKGIGAARRWVFQKFQQFSSENFNRLLPSYLQFDTVVCGLARHLSPFAVLPGIDTNDHTIIIIESHLDSRCEVLCDTSCIAEGVDDNGSGTALVIELARVLSHFTFNHTLVFISNIGEEQGLIGAEAFADYATEKGIQIKAVQNNDIVGGILCGKTSSPPSCSPEGDIDSTEIRLFSFGSFNSPHKSFVRYIKLEYKENILPGAKIPMSISVMSAEDRTGRGGDHIPFRQHGYTAMRFTSANENGNAKVTDTSYHDNQHTSRDVFGYDTNSDLVIDSFLVDVNYLQRNAIINANSAAMAGISPKVPDFTFTISGNGMNLTITEQTQYKQYRVGVRQATNDFDSVYTINSLDAAINLGGTGLYFVSVASVDTNGIESFFSEEQMVITVGIENILSHSGIAVLPVKPNPADDATVISFYSESNKICDKSFLQLVDSRGNIIERISVQIKQGINEIMYKHTTQIKGAFNIQLMCDQNIMAKGKIIFQ